MPPVAGLIFFPMQLIMDETADLADSNASPEARQLGSPALPTELKGDFPSSSSEASEDPDDHHDEAGDDVGDSDDEEAGLLIDQAAASAPVSNTASLSEEVSAGVKREASHDDSIDSNDTFVTCIDASCNPFILI